MIHSQDNDQSELRRFCRVEAFLMDDWTRKVASNASRACTPGLDDFHKTGIEDKSLHCRAETLGGNGAGSVRTGRRLAHELKNRSIPLTVEICPRPALNMSSSSKKFSVKGLTLTAESANLETIIGRLATSRRCRRCERSPFV